MKGTRKIEIEVTKEWIDESLEKAGFETTRKNRTRLMKELQAEVEGMALEKVLEWTIARMKELHGTEEIQKLDVRDDVEVCPNCGEVQDELIDGECCSNCERYYKQRRKYEEGEVE